MFQVTKSTAKIISQSACAYVYRDGVALWEERTVGKGKYSARLDIFHIFPCEIAFYSSNFGGYSWKKADGGERSAPIETRSMGVHNPKLLLSGLASVRATYHSKSEAMEDRGLDGTSVLLVMANGQEVDLHIFPWVSSQIWVSPDPVNARYEQSGFATLRETVAKWAESSKNIIEMHGEWTEEVV
jgi:hypothetical protein